MAKLVKDIVRVVKAVAIAVKGVDFFKNIVVVVKALMRVVKLVDIIVKIEV